MRAVISKIGTASKQRKMGRFSSIFGASLMMSSCALDNHDHDYPVPSCDSVGHHKEGVLYQTMREWDCISTDDCTNNLSHEIYTG